MKKYEFEELKNQYCKITEAIELYDSGNHSEYDEDDLNDELDKIHVELCEAVSDIAQYLIDKIDDGEEVKMTKKDLADIHYLNALYNMACSCKDYCYEPELFDLTKSYGNGVIDGIGADFYVCSCKRGKYLSFGYREFYQLLEEYELIID